MNDTAAFKALKHSIIDRYAKPDDRRGLIAASATLVPLLVLWACVPFSAQVSYGLTACVVALISLFLVRAFVLMHECGHGSLFKRAGLNRAFGFAFGVLTAMPQYVWSKHHLFHHTTNGNWARYRGPLNIVAVDDYAAMTGLQKHWYRHSRSVWLAPLGGFAYLFLNPRITWFRGSVGLVSHIVSSKWNQPGAAIRSYALEFKTPYWSSRSEYWHMFWNNVFLLGLIAAMAWLVGPMLFLVCYVVSISLAGGVGLVLFTVQHNFEHSYASGEDGWDLNRAALNGTSLLVLPRWLNWFTASIGFHHVHHLSARVPFYHLAECHAEHHHHFRDVKRLTLSQVPAALRCVLWDTGSRRIISVREHSRQSAARTSA